MRLMHIMLWAVLPLVAITGRAQALPDPTRPAQYQSAIVVQDLPTELHDWRVTAIRISAQDRSAIVNGRIVRTGDDIGPATVLEIQPVQVILDYDNTKVAVRLFNDINIRQPASNSIRTESRGQ
ncbi:MAG: general secretion pathway protein GspB [Gammaproteobacteria bacterium]